MLNDFFKNITFSIVGTAIFETLYMTIVSTFFAYLIGLPLGILLVTTSENGITPKKNFHRVLSYSINLLRSIPFVVLMVAVIPFSRIVFGTGIGPTAMLLPLLIAAAPFVARLVESSLLELDSGIIEAAQSMGASNTQIVFKVFLSEALPSLLSGATIATTTILGYSTLSGFVGAGGLGTLAINYGYYRKEFAIMFVMIVLLIIIVQLFQEIGNSLTKSIDKRIKNK